MYIKSILAFSLAIFFSPNILMASPSQKCDVNQANSKIKAAKRDRLEADFDDTFDELNKKAVLRFFNAKTGCPVSKGRVSFMGQNALTDRDGRAVFDLDMVDLDDEEYLDKKVPVRFSKKGYYSVKYDVQFMAGSIFFNRFSVSEVLKPGRYRIVLDWGDNPTDLDAHFIKGTDYHISYRKMKNYKDKAWLDRDDRNGNGPETVTILNLDPQANYTYYVHDYTKSGNLKKSRAHVYVYSDQGLEGSYSVPKSLKGDHWTVFKIAGGSITIP